MHFRVRKTTWWKFEWKRQQKFSRHCTIHDSHRSFGFSRLITKDSMGFRIVDGIIEKSNPKELKVNKSDRKVTKIDQKLNPSYWIKWDQSGPKSTTIEQNSEYINQNLPKPFKNLTHFVYSINYLETNWNFVIMYQQNFKSIFQMFDSPVSQSPLKLLIWFPSEVLKLRVSCINLECCDQF